VRWRARRDSYSIRRPPVRPPLVLLQQRGGGGGGGGLDVCMAASRPGGLPPHLQDSGISFGISCLCIHTFGK